MYDYFDKHGKKFLAVVGTLLALVFLLPPAFNGFGGGGGSARLGKVDGQRIDGDDVLRSQNTLRSIERLVAPDRGPDGQSSQVPLPQLIFNDGLYRQLQQNPVLSYLLMHEAQQAGALPDERELDRFLTAPVQLTGNNGELIAMDKVNPTVKDALRDDLRRVMGIVNYFRRTQSAIKISRPLINDELARQTQQIKARVAVFDATTYENQVPTPTPEELKRQFDAYADVNPVASDANPFGFGYRTPDRVAAQWLCVTDAEATKAVEASKAAELWEEDALIYYQRNQTTFSRVVPPATQPTTRPFADVRSEVLTTLRGPLIEQKKRAVANRIVQMMTADFTKASKTPSTQQATVNYTVAYGSFDYLQKLADDVQKQTGVRPTAVAPAGLQSQVELQKQPGFGGTMLTDRAMGFAGGSAYLFNALKALHPTRQPTGESLEIGQPSVVLTGSDGLYVVRAVTAEPAQAAKSMDDIKELVEKDVRRSRAFTLAADAAQATLEKAKSADGLEKTGVAVQTSDWFGVESATPAGLTGDYAAGLVGPAFETLRGVATRDALPTYTVAKLRREGTAAVVEVFDVRTDLNTVVVPQAIAQAESTVGRSLLPSGFVEAWFNFDAVSRRTHYVPDAPREPTDSAPARPVNPLMPG
ncbi:MAG TPA: hypothetical protein VF595_01735 [Tepidisphaeraceae bacterium]|jgi:hypothetical protein